MAGYEGIYASRRLTRKNKKNLTIKDSVRQRTGKNPSKEGKSSNSIFYIEKLTDEHYKWLLDNDPNYMIPTIAYTRTENVVNKKQLINEFCMKFNYSNGRDFSEKNKREFLKKFALTFRPDFWRSMLNQRSQYLDDEIFRYILLIDKDNEFRWDIINQNLDKLRISYDDRSRFSPELMLDLLQQGKITLSSIIKRTSLDITEEILKYAGNVTDNNLLYIYGMTPSRFKLHNSDYMMKDRIRVINNFLKNPQYDDTERSMQIVNGKKKKELPRKFSTKFRYNFYINARPEISSIIDAFYEENFCK